MNFSKIKKIKAVLPENYFGKKCKNDKLTWHLSR